MLEAKERRTGWGSHKWFLLSGPVEENRVGCTLGSHQSLKWKRGVVINN